MSSWEVGLVVVAIAAGLFVARLWRAAEERANGLQAEVDLLAEKTARLEADLSKETRARGRQAEDLAALRKKADKTKRRKEKAVEQPLGTTARIRDHEDRVERVESERDRAKAERDALAEQVAGLEARLEVSSRELAAAKAPPAAAAPPEAPDAGEALQAELESSRAQTAELDEALRASRQTEARLRKRMENQEQLYASLRAELDVKKDRLRTQEEQLQRLQALKVAVID
jgi:chromosome segregation ATPase